jgi:drug/metabolite transporter (DMT)-like permease
MGILLGLLTALSWGSSDFVGRFAARRIGALRTMLYMQLTGLVLLTIFVHWMGGLGHLFDGSGWRPWAWGVLAGILNGISSLALYRSFEVGKLAVVAPLSASYPALTVAISVLTGEHLTSTRAVGIALVLAGVIVVARGEAASTEHSVHPPKSNSEDESASAPKRSSGVGTAFVAAVGFGFLFWLLGNRVVPRVGFAASVWLIRLTCSLLTVLLMVVMRQRISLPRKDPVSLWLLSMGLMDTGAFVMNNLGMQLEQVSIVSVLASLYGAVTVLFSTVVLHEKMSRWQWLGIAAIFGGITLISRL